MFKLYCVTTHSTFRHQYLVEVPDTVSPSVYVQQLLDSDTPPEEWQQVHLGEVVVSQQLYTYEKAEQEHKDSGPNGNPWLPLEQIIARK